jgi:hypothetical protein
MAAPIKTRPPVTLRRRGFRTGEGVNFSCWDWVHPPCSPHARRAIVAGSALAVEMIYSPPYWVHALLWGPLILLTTLVPLRPIKGLMIGLQFHYKA